MSVIGPRPGLWNQDILTAERDKYNATYDKSQIIEKDTSEGIRNIFQLDFEYFYSGEETVHDCYRMNFEDLGNHYSVKIRHGQNNKLKRTCMECASSVQNEAAPSGTGEIHPFWHNQRDSGTDEWRSG